MKKIPYALIIMDGYGLAPAGNGNAVTADGSKNIVKFMKDYPSASLGASGLSVGLPDGQMGNSEVGHMNIGAGRIVYQDFTGITHAVETGEFFKNPVLAAAMDCAAKNGKKLHLMGLLSPGGVHSHTDHLYALLEMAAQRGLKTAYVHCFTDGRDTSPQSGVDYVKELQNKMDKLGIGKIASVSGRYYAMDRNNNWERVELAYDMMTLGNGKHAENPAEAIKASYAEGVTDEFILPTNICENGKPVGLLEKGDSVIYFNFRPDRAAQLTNAVSQKDFSAFERKSGFLQPHFVCFTAYSQNFKDVSIAFPKKPVKNTLAEYLSVKGKTQLHIAEKEKFKHLTYFFNGASETVFKNEDRIFIDSAAVDTFDLKPEMSAREITDNAIKELESGKYDAVFINYANCDMVGHSGNFDATVKAVGTVDKCVKEVADKVLQLGGATLLTADHGNAENLLAADGGKMTAHTTNPVPVVLISDKYKGAELRKDGILADLAPTFLEIMGLPVPAEMTGKSLIKK